MCPLRNSEVLPQPIRLELCKKQITFSEFLAPLLNITEFLNILKKKMTPIAYIFRKLRSAKDVVK